LIFRYVGVKIFLLLQTWTVLGEGIVASTVRVVQQLLPVDHLLDSALLPVCLLLQIASLHKFFLRIAKHVGFYLSLLLILVNLYCLLGFNLLQKPSVLISQLLFLQLVAVPIKEHVIVVYLVEIRGVRLVICTFNLGPVFKFKQYALVFFEYCAQEVASCTELVKDVPHV
jgi:hypothetical protein